MLLLLWSVLFLWPVTVFVLKSVLSDISIAAPTLFACFHLHGIFPPTHTLSFCVSFHLTWVSYKQYKYISIVCSRQQHLRGNSWIILPVCRNFGDMQWLPDRMPACLWPKSICPWTLLFGPLSTLLCHSQSIALPFFPVVSAPWLNVVCSEYHVRRLGCCFGVLYWKQKENSWGTWKKALTE